MVVLWGPGEGDAKADRRLSHSRHGSAVPLWGTEIPASALLIFEACSQGLAGLAFFQAADSEALWWGVGYGTFPVGGPEVLVGAFEHL